MTLGVGGLQQIGLRSTSNEYDDRWLTVRMITIQLNRKEKSGLKISSEDLDMLKIYVKTAPRHLNDDHKECRMQVD